MAVVLRFTGRKAVQADDRAERRDGAVCAEIVILPCVRRERTDSHTPVLMTVLPGQLKA